jgi:hypothetical protein
MSIIKTSLVAAALLCAAPASARTLDQRLHAMPPLEGVFQLLNIADAATTIDLLHRGYQERNPLLGKHPSDGAVIGQTVAIALLHAAGTSFLQDHAPGAVKLWEISTITVKASCVGWNLHFRF